MSEESKTSTKRAAARPAGRRDGRVARSASRLGAVQALYQLEITGADWREVVQEFVQHRLGQEVEGEQYHKADIPHFRRTIEFAVLNQASIDQLTDRALVKSWPLGRLDPILRALFRAAAAEMTGRPEIPARVVIGEYMDVARAFFTEKRELGFVNAVLDQVMREARPDALSDPRSRG
ncbi:MAG TPA: transcription antitermination factor NusB [Paracoccaceae bacterium]|nr:transcription antitermination factor NusB [Paracoccaceae bacterium]